MCLMFMKGPTAGVGARVAPYVRRRCRKAKLIYMCTLTLGGVGEETFCSSTLFLYYGICTVYRVIMTEQMVLFVR